MIQVRTSPDYSQSNGKIERRQKTLKGDAIRRGRPDSLEKARAQLTPFVEHYNTVRLHSSLGYLNPADFLADRASEIWATGDARLEAAREARRVRRTEAHKEAA